MRRSNNTSNSAAPSPRAHLPSPAVAGLLLLIPAACVLAPMAYISYSTRPQAPDAAPPSAPGSLALLSVATGVGSRRRGASGGSTTQDHGAEQDPHAGAGAFVVDPGEAARYQPAHRAHRHALPGGLARTLTRARSRILLAGLATAHIHNPIRRGQAAQRHPRGALRLRPARLVRALLVAAAPARPPAAPL